MSIRPASPPPVARWKFVLGTILFLAVALTAWLLGASPPGVGTMLVVVLCLGGSVALSVAPYLIEYEARLRLAEAQAGDHIETQVRRLTQTTEQLAHAISRSQSSEERAGQALGTLEELSDKLIAQADELAQGLARASEREVSGLRNDVDRLHQERDTRLNTLEQRLDALSGELKENLGAVKKTQAAAARSLEELKERMIALAARLDESSRAPSGTKHIGPGPTSVMLVGPATATCPNPEPALPVIDTFPVKESPAAPPAGGSTDGAAASAEQVTGLAREEPLVASPRPRARRAPESSTSTATRVSARPQPMELPLTGGSEVRPRDPSGGSSTLVATAYIGIGNKLYVRGEGPGLSWEQGVPMQFLAIGKWGWTSPEADASVTCRIYRNDDTPMLDENIVIAPGARTEITPRF